MNITEEKKPISNRIQGFEINISEEHSNWLTVGEIIHSIQKPISKYVDEVVKSFHKKLCNDLLAIGKCCSPGDCKKKTKSSNLCRSCQGWIKELKTSHEKGDNPAWHKNCESYRWSEDHWEVAKFFMPALGNNLTTVKDAETTDLSSLLNVLEWMKDEAFVGKTRVNVELVRNLRSQVRNIWAHAPNQELTGDKKGEGFSIANDFLEDLEKVFPNTENEKCSKYLGHLKADGVKNVAESELQSLLLQRHLLCDIKEEITRINDERSSDKRAIEEKLSKLESAFAECFQRIADFENLKENINKQFNLFKEKLECFPEDIHEIRNDIGQIRDHLAMMNNRQNEDRVPKSCVPEKVPQFTGREAEIQKVVSSLKNEETTIVSIHGGPGFGKTAIAVEVSHKLSNEHNIPVVFSDLSTATKVDEVIREMCRDVGVNHDEDPKSSLILWLRNIKDKVIFVLDDIDNLLLEKTDFYAFIRLLRKNSNQRCQILTTSRTSYKIPEFELSTAEVQVNEMDDEACVKLLRKKCPNQDGNFVRKLAKLCGKIPLAMCIAGTRVEDFENSEELLQYLEKQPMETLESPKRNQYVYRAIDMSYKKLEAEKKKTFVRLAVFEGNFSEEAAREVIEKDDLDTKRILEDLVSRSLIKQPTKHRYSIHLLIKHYLNVQPESEEKRAAKARAEVSMVRYYLKLGNDLTIQSYSKDGYKENREALKKEAHNIENVLKICCQQKDITSEISNCLVDSEIYTTSSRYFSLLVKTIIPGSTVDKFLQQCAKLAEERKQHAMKINIDCLLAYQERINTIGKSDELFNVKMVAIQKEFGMHYEEVKEDKSICAHYYYQYGRYLFRKSEEPSNSKNRLDLLNDVLEQFKQSLLLRKELPHTSAGEADKVFSLLQIGVVYKKIASATRSFKQGELDYEKSMKNAQKYFEKAIQLSKSKMGDHELTSTCYKNLGDLLLEDKNHKEAEENYNIAKEMREDLGLDSSVRHAYLLNNLGSCLTLSHRAQEAIELLERARDMAEKLAESDDPNACKTKVYKSLAIAYDSVGSEKAGNYAKKALALEKALNKFDIKELKKISDNGKQQINEFI